MDVVTAPSYVSLLALGQELRYHRSLYGTTYSIAQTILVQRGTPPRKGLNHSTSLKIWIVDPKKGVEKKTFSRFP
jgi:hypothetical protein